jgi:beta-ureidopropionase
LKQVKFAAIQMGMKPSDKEANISKAEHLIEKAVERFDPEIVGLPELFSTEFFPVVRARKYFKYAEGIPGPTIDRISKIARRHKIFVIAPIFEVDKRKARYYNTSTVIDPNGKIVGKSRKTEIPLVEWNQGNSIWNKNYEKFYFRPGSTNDVIRVREIRLGQLICYSRHFPEGWRKLELAGADLIYVPVASNGPVLSDLFSVETRALAFMHQCFAVVVNRVGREGPCNFFGGSHIVDPFGKILAGPAGTSEEILFATLDLAQVKDSRKKVPFLRDRRPDLYAKN